MGMTILMLGQHAELGLYRAEYLRGHGYQVIFPQSKQEAIAGIRSAEYDAVILSYTLSHKTVMELRELIEQSRPACPVITLTEQPWPDNKIPSDRTVPLSAGPEALLKAVQAIRQNGIQRVK
jgi:DNA-binding response OmpR family regulator